MLLLLRYELLKTYRKLRTYIGFGLVLTLIPLIYWGLSVGGQDMVDNMTRGLQRDFLFVGTLFNGWFVSNMVMNTLFVDIPFLIVLVAGDILAGEATSGTYRLILTRPPSRTKVFAAKALAAICYAASLVAFLALLSIGLGTALFGTGNMLVFTQAGVAIFTESDIWWRFILSYGLAIWAMCVVAALAMLFSALVENSIGPIVGSMAVVILFLVLGNLPFEFFENLRPYLFTSYMDVWSKMFENPIDWGDVAKNVLILLGFWTLFTGTAWILFLRKDVSS